MQFMYVCECIKKGNNDEFKGFLKELKYKEKRSNYMISLPNIFILVSFFPFVVA